ncbi:hypothetical protein DPEC_G00009120 [Dallia pectoralis]|uniref:Uncharacterized protein n=1 Tax=Dallia pectoralis TaxID=75939 RepID=A0ACC2HKP6_DALPE|nr:hypothetical protein DPEC_G00009120 [Dallia pectoralis]
MDKLLRELHKRGHYLTVVRSSTSWYVPEHAPHFSSVTVTVSRASNLEDPQYMASFLKSSLDIWTQERSILSFLKLQTEMINLLEEAHRCSAEMAQLAMEDERLMERFRAAKFDIMLTDPGLAGGVLLGNYLGLPIVLSVRWITNAEGHFAIAPSPLSYIPTIGSIVTDKMSFVDRVKNIFHYGIALYVDHSITRPQYQGVIDKFIDPTANVYSLIQGVDLWLMRVDFVFEFPRPTMPNVVYMGGFQCKPSKPLPADLEAFVQSSGEHGLVVMSLGSMLGSLPTKITEVIAAAFARLPQKVVWRHTGERPSTLGNNTLLVNWLPQNDLLGHPKTRAFVTHGGTNGIYEAIYHGVPMLGIPLIFDQFDNMLRLQARGVANYLQVTALEVETLTQALTDILEKTKPFGENMQRMSKLHHDTPVKPMDNAIFWIEFAMRHKGAGHLRTESYKMPWYAYHNVDVWALLTTTVVSVLLLTVMTCGVLGRVVCKRK